MNIHDHGENDPLDFNLSEGWQAVAKFGREAIETNRQARNDEDGEAGGQAVSMPNLFDKATRTRMAGLYGAPKQRTDAWHDRQLRHAKECIAQADKRHTPEEVAAAQAALAVDPSRNRSGRRGS